MDETLELFVLGFGTTAFVVGGITNTLSFVTSYAGFQELKQRFPNSYTEKIEQHVATMQRAYQKDTGQKIFSFPGMYVAKYLTR